MSPVEVDAVTSPLEVHQVSGIVDRSAEVQGTVMDVSTAGATLMSSVVRGTCSKEPQ